MIGGSGNGEQISANKVRGIRAALAWSQETARLAREHNDAQVLAIGARLHATEEALGFVATFLATPFSGDPRHARRIDMLTAYEATGDAAAAADRLTRPRRRPVPQVCPYRGFAASIGR